MTETETQRASAQVGAVGMRVRDSGSRENARGLECEESMGKQLRGWQRSRTSLSLEQRGGDAVVFSSNRLRPVGLSCLLIATHGQPVAVAVP